VKERKDNELSRVYNEGAWPEPRRQIDEAILLASRRAARARHPVLHRFGTPFALAASVVLAVTLAVMVSERESGRELKDYFPRSPEPAAEPKRDTARKIEAPAKAEPDAAPAPRELFASPMGPDKALPKPAAPPAAKSAPAPAAKNPAAPAAKAPLAPLAKAQPAPAAQPPRRVEPAPAPERADRIRREVDQLQENRQAAGIAAPQATQREAETRPAAPIGATTSVTAAGVLGFAAARAPEAWLDDIRKLRAQGRSEDAARELAEFRKRYPDYRVPDDLR
jgi:hypothetical protein